MNTADIWVQYFWIRFKNSERVRGNELLKIPPMKDYQKFWYHALLMESIYSERPGMIPNDTRSLFRLAGCTANYEFFLKNCGCVIESFQKTSDGAWLFHPKAKEIAEKLNQVGRSTKAEKDNYSLSSLLTLTVVDFDLIEKATEELFSFYVVLFERRSSYTLTEQRRKKCAARLVEYMKANRADIEAAKEAAKQAMKALRANKWNWEKGYYDWIDHLFDSQELFQKRLEAKVDDTEDELARARKVAGDDDF